MATVLYTGMAVLLLLSFHLSAAISIQFFTQGKGKRERKRKRNKVIRPKSRASALAKKSGRQTDKHSFSKKYVKKLFTTSSIFSTIQRHEKCDKKP